MHQAFELTISFKSRTIVVKPENVLHIRHAFFCGYDSGHGVSFFTPSTLAQYLSMSDLSIDHPSIVVIVEPYAFFICHFCFNFFNFSAITCARSSNPSGRRFPDAGRLAWNSNTNVACSTF